MPNIKAFIDECITNKAYSTGNNLFGKISLRVKTFMEARQKGSLDANMYKGIDKVIADRVNVLFKPSDETTISIPTSSETKKKKNVFDRPEEGESEIDGYVVWSGNEALICPWLTEYISSSGSENSDGSLTPTASVAYGDFCTTIPFNSTQVLTDQNRQIAISSTKIAKFSKTARKMVIGLKNDNLAFTSDGIDGSPLKVTDLTDVLPSAAGHWCFGKILKSNDYLIVQTLTFPSAEVKDDFERPKYYIASKDEARGHTVESKLILINTFTGEAKKIETTPGAAQTKLHLIRGYTDFIVHKNKIFAIRSKDTPTTVTFTGNKLGTVPDVQGLVVLGRVRHTFDSYSYEIVEIVPAVVGTLTLTTKLVASVTPTAPDSDGKFGLKGSQIAYCCAKLAASDLNPYTFYVQLYYELILQMPYNYDKGYKTCMYWETTLAEKMRTDTEYKAWIYADGASVDSYGSALIMPISSVRFGSIVKLAGTLYYEIPTQYVAETGNYSRYSCDLIYELVSEARSIFDPTTTDWKAWQTGYGSNPLDIWVIWHLVNKDLGEGSSKTPAIVSNLGLTVFECAHPIWLEIKALLPPDGSTASLSKMQKAIYQNNKFNPDPTSSAEKTKWAYILPKLPGEMPFPYEKRYTYYGGNRGATNGWAISGYDSWSETFLVSFAGVKFPVGGVRTVDTARPCLIIGGIGYYAEAWGAKGWGDQLTQSPIVVEVYNYEAVNNIAVAGFEAVTSSTQPKVYMQGNHSVLGTIGNYWTGYDMTDPTIELKHGMYPIPQNGFNFNADKDKIINTSICFTDMRIPEDKLNTVYYALFIYGKKYNETKRKWELDNYYIHNRAYEFRLDRSTPPKMDLWAAKAMAGWWSSTAPAKATDPVPWWGPCQIDLHIKI